MKGMNLWNIGRTLFLFSGLLFLSGCGGGGPSSSAPEVVCNGDTRSTNEMPSAAQLTVYQSTCQGAVNEPVVTLTICVPNSTNCENVSNILVDLGSTGLRLSHTLAISSSLPQESENGGLITECYGFVSGYNYGPVVTASVTLGNQSVTVPVQISNSALSAPSSCTTSSTGTSAPFEPYINGILGLLFPQDDSLDGQYYEGGSGPTTISSSLEVQNPVFLLPTSENNGVLLSGFPTVSTTQGDPTVSGLLTFGTGTASGLTQLTTNSSAIITASYNGQTLKAFFDTGSNGWFIENPNIPTCTSSSLQGFFCGTATTQSATLTGTNGSSVKLNFSIENAQTLFNTGNQDFSSLGGPLSNIFDAGFPAFLYGYTIGVGWGSDVNTTGKGYFLYGK